MQKVNSITVIKVLPSFGHTSNDVFEFLKYLLKKKKLKNLQLLKKTNCVIVEGNTEEIKLLIKEIQSRDFSFKWDYL